ncbi:MAG: NusG domain II-containing protein [Thermodesulfobacteriota bacterium]|nr:NusG domain II-containing protein [Thermodesulfobacteriota bacterium]
MNIFQETTIADKIMIASILTTCLIWAIFLFKGTSLGQEVEIYNMNGLLGIYSLDQDTTINVPGPLGYTVVAIKSCKVSVKSSPCPNKICVLTGKIEHTGEGLICIPNKVNVIIKGKKQKFDTLSY